MDEIRRRDRQLFIRQLCDPMRLVMTLGALLFLYLISHGNRGPAVLLFAPIVLGASAISAWNASIHLRFHNKRSLALWKGCEDRLKRFEEVLTKLRKDQIASLDEMPKTIRSVAESLYVALRKADMIAHEVNASESGMIAQPPAWKAGSSDPQSQELYRLADKNIAEYRAQYAGVMAGVERTEAQSAVFMTTVDTLRMKMIGYRLVGKNPEMGSHDFLEALAEARLQLQSIDTALDELDLGHYPKNIAVVPPPLPEEAQQQLRQGQ